MRSILKTICSIVAVLFALATIYFFVSPLVQAFLLYQDGLQEQEAFNEAVLPLIGKGWLTAFITGVLGTIAIGGIYRFKED